MTMLESCSPTLQNPEDQLRFDEMQLAAASFLARYSGGTLEAYRHDLRGFFQWAADHDIDVLAQPARTSSCSGPGWRGAVSPPPRSTDGCRRSAGSTASLTSTAASARTLPSTSDARKSTRVTLEGSTAPSSACSCSPPSSTTATTRHSLCCLASTAFA